VAGKTMYEVVSTSTEKKDVSVNFQIVSFNAGFFGQGGSKAYTCRRKFQISKQKLIMIF
jgi:hypothetical protein